jgi:putative transposase
VEEWKSFSARQINAYLEHSGSVWAPDYFDRFMRDEQHFETTKAYVEMNPVKAGLCARSEEWRFSSAGWRVAPDT